MHNLRDLDILIRVTERMFHCQPGMILSQDRSQPLVSFRQLAIRVAREAGYSVGMIALSFKRDTDTIKENHKRAGEKLVFEWWGHAKADLYDRWQEALDEHG